MKPHPKPSYMHLVDFKYETARNEFIEEAVKYANKQFGGKSPHKGDAANEEWGKKWNGAYHSKMNRLAEGLCRA